MTRLIDVNALIALAHTVHVHHAAALRWYGARKAAGEAVATCSIVELGFIRVSVQAGLQPDVSTARKALAKLKASAVPPFVFLVDDLGADVLPAYVSKPGQVTDGHLAALASRYGARLATLDAGIPGAERIA